MKLTLDYPPIWLLGFAVLAWAAGRLLPMPLPGAGVAGWLLVVAGLALMAAAALQMLKRRTTLDPHGAPSALVTDGLYRFSRNPIYVADALILAGLALIWQAPLALLLVPAFAAVITRRFILPEEARLAARFPAGFAGYAARTRRWL